MQSAQCTSFELQEFFVGEGGFGAVADWVQIGHTETTLL